MGILNWLRTLLGGRRVCCDVCRTEIPASDFAKGRAVVLARKKFCRLCVEWVMQGHQREEWKLRGIWPPPALHLSSSSTPLLG